MITPIRVRVSVIEQGIERPAKKGEVLVEFAWGSAPWQHFSVKTGYTYRKGSTTSHNEGDHIAIYDRRPGETGYDAAWYHITAMLNSDHSKRKDICLYPDDNGNSYDIGPSPCRG